MALERLLKQIWPEADQTDIKYGSEDEDFDRLWGAGMRFYLGRGKDHYESSVQANNDLKWVKGEIFLEEHPKNNKLPWSGKKGNRG